MNEIFIPYVEKSIKMAGQFWPTGFHSLSRTESLGGILFEREIRKKKKKLRILIRGWILGSELTEGLL